MTLSALLAACGGGGGGSSSGGTTTPVTPTPTATGISLASSLATVPTDNTTSTTITATVVNASNAAVAGVPITFSVDSGLLSASTGTSDASGKATVTLTSGTNASTRTATVVATASGQTSQLPVRIGGSSLTAMTSSTALAVGGSAATITVVAKNSANVALSGQTITLSQSGGGTVVLGSTTGTTDASGTFTTSVSPTVGGSVVVTVTGVGETRTLTFAVTGASTTAFQITAPTSSATTAVVLGANVPFSVLAPAPATRVTFSSTLGTWTATSGSVISGSGTGVLTLTPAAGGTATAQLTSSSAGVANVQVFDPDHQASASDSRSVSFTAACSTASRVTLQSSPSVVAPSSGGTSSLSTLVATVTDASGNPAGNCPVAFSILNATGGGETISPAVALTAAAAGSGTGLGQASTTFTAGSLPSGAGGVQVRATVVQPGSSTVVATGTTSSPDATIVIGGTAGSITIGRSTVISDSANGTIYVLPMSVLVSDSNGNAVANAVVSLSTWPLGFNVGGAVCTGTATTAPTQAGTFYFNEDRNENLVRDPGEVTAARLLFPSGASSGTTPPAGNTSLTPPSSAAGSLPSTVTTGTNGVATFSLTYTKSNAGYIVDRIRARTLVQGTETKGEILLQLPILLTDLGPPCLLSSSPYQ